MESNRTVVAEEEIGSGRRHVSRWTRFKQSWRQTSSWNKLMVLLTAVLATSTSLYTHYERKQFRTMHEQLSEMQASGHQTDRLIGLYSNQLDQLTKQAADTHVLAEQAKNQADRTKDIADRTLQQANATNKLAEATRDSVSLSKANSEKALAETHTNFIRSERPYIYITTPMNPPIFEVGKPPQWHIQYANFGRSPAIDVHGCMFLTLVHQPPPLSISDLMNMLPTPPVICPGKDRTSVNIAVLPPGGVNYGIPGAPSSRLMSQADIDMIRAFSASLVVAGAWEYQDMAGNTYKSTFCSFYDGPTGTVFNCPRYNGME